ncbi:AAA family ATPase [Escherichia coli]|uniref:ATP-dependent nuclease n=1 Tax=Enterobacteriaceae TaxID=543 RepID=UPI000493B821|nr:MULTISPECIES: AAA family ATPase [Enterobacteriaceae]MCV8782379.1 AAA family ATPase [Escherichia coli]MDH0218041.1 AAA family ATPase [Citrobacter freundii]MDH0226529.1 AAA family ATPase [Citrobacter freundii]MDH0245169.1 AAA family ATPase [Citrobacter freundii]MDH0983892.1 AAA family ATPase [Citrobacter freundii]
MSTELKLKKIMASSKIEPFIRHIRFPFFKNLAEGSKIDFEYPITALVGQNGTNKSSVLRALFGSPNNYSLGSLWFSTDVDEIKDGGRSRFIYGYYDKATDSIVEVIKTRISKENDPDYWEPSRPLKSDNMAPMPSTTISTNQLRTRWKAIDKNVIYLDFRATISAFDKFFYHSDFHTYPKKDYLRKRSQMLKDIIDNDLKKYQPHKGKKDKLFVNTLLEKSKVEAISKILGRKYTSIRLIEHSLFTNDKAPTIILQSENLKYSEAFAGSGEFAVSILVHKLMDSPDASLILLDEPEVSLHPSAQCQLMEFLSEQALKKKHQIVISTHSSTIVKDLPKNAIKLFCLNDKIGKVDVLQNVSPEESFFILGERIDKRTVIVEDRLAKRFVEKALKAGGEALLNSFEVKHVPGGAGSILQTLAVPLCVANVKNVIFLLDGDQSRTDDYPTSDSIPENQNTNLQNIIKKITNQDIKFSCDGSNGSSNNNQKYKMQRNFIDFIHDKIAFLPVYTPEAFLIENVHGDYKEYKDQIPKNIQDAKEITKELCKLDTGLENVTSDDIFETQIRILNKIPNNHEVLTKTRELLQIFLDNDTIRPRVR